MRLHSSLGSLIDTNSHGTNHGANNNEGNICNDCSHSPAPRLGFSAKELADYFAGLPEDAVIDAAVEVQIDGHLDRLTQDFDAAERDPERVTAA